MFKEKKKEEGRKKEIRDFRKKNYFLRIRIFTNNIRFASLNFYRALTSRPSYISSTFSAKRVKLDSVSLLVDKITYEIAM